MEVAGRLTKREKEKLAINVCTSDDCSSFKQVFPHRVKQSNSGAAKCLSQI